MDQNDEARDAFGAGGSDASKAFGGSAQPTRPAPARGVAPPSAPQPPSQAFADVGQAQPSVTPPSGQTTPPAAIAALLLSLAGMFFCPFIPSVFALVFAGRARRLIASDPERYSGSKMVTIASILAWLSIIVTTIIVAAVVVEALGSG